MINLSPFGWLKWSLWNRKVWTGGGRSGGSWIDDFPEERPSGALRKHRQTRKRKNRMARMARRKNRHS